MRRPAPVQENIRPALRRRLGPRKRKGFGLDSLIMIVSAIVIIAIMVGISKVFMTSLEDSYVSLTTTMPRFSMGNSTAQNSTSVQGTSSSLLSVYEMLRSGTVWAMGALLVIAGVLFMLEQVEVVPSSTAYGIISRGALYFVVLFGFPPLWDLYATGIEDGSRAIMDPHGTGQTPPSVILVFSTINGMGISHGQLPQVDNALLSNLIQLFNGANILSSFSDTGKSFILGLVGGLMALVASFLTYMFSAIRQVLTAVLVAGLPVILVLSLVPWFQGITKRLLDTLFGLSVVPVFSSLVMVTGSAYLGSISSHPVEEQWFASVAVLTLATFVPTILVPMLGTLFGSVTGMVSSGIGFGGMMSMFAARTGQGIGGGALSAIQGAQTRAGEYDVASSGMQMMQAGVIGGLRGGLGGIVKGTTHASSQMLRKLGAGEISREVQNAGTGFANRMQESSSQYGREVMQSTVDEKLTDTSAAIMGKVATEPVPEDQRELHLQQGMQLLEIARHSKDTKDYTEIIGHPYFRSVPVRDKEKFAQKIAETISNQHSDPDKLANISYNLDKMGGLNDKNLKEFIKSHKSERSAHQKGRSKNFEENS